MVKKKMTANGWLLITVPDEWQYQHPPKGKLVKINEASNLK
jgi:hypothetical protein